MSSSQESNGIHFLKVILERTLQRGKLRVPTSFVKRYWEGISNPVTLKLPNKTEWKVNWKKHDDGDIWFCNNGWKDFTNHVSLSKLQFVVFQYQGDSCFNVNVLGKHGLEIKYKETTQQEFEEVAESDSSSSVKVLDYIPPSSSSKRSKSPIIPYSENYKKRKTTDGKKVEVHSGCHKAAAKYINTGSMRRKDVKEKIKSHHESVKKEFQSNKDFFTCAIHKTYLDRYLMIIPNEFSNPHLHKTEGRTATLFDKDRSWDVKLKRNTFGNMTFTTGWRNFCFDNNLKIGDICAFVLNNPQELSFQVVIFRLEVDS